MLAKALTAEADGLAAKAVDRHGAAYLPIFERLEAELAAREHSRGAKASAHQWYRDVLAIDGTVT